MGPLESSTQTRPQSYLGLLSSGMVHQLTHTYYGSDDSFHVLICETHVHAHAHAHVHAHAHAHVSTCTLV